MADHEVISYWKLGDTSLRDQRNQRLSETVNTGGGGEKKKKEKYQKVVPDSCPTRQDSESFTTATLLDRFLKITMVLKLWAHARMNERGT